MDDIASRSSSAASAQLELFRLKPFFGCSFSSEMRAVEFAVGSVAFAAGSSRVTWTLTYLSTLFFTFLLIALTYFQTLYCRIGLRIGDKMVKFNQQECSTQAIFYSFLQATLPGDFVEYADQFFLDSWNHTQFWR